MKILLLSFIFNLILGWSIHLDAQTKKQRELMQQVLVTENHNPTRERGTENDADCSNTWSLTDVSGYDVTATLMSPIPKNQETQEDRTTDFQPDQSKLPTPPPKGAIVLFDGKNPKFVSMAGKKINWPIKDGALVSTQKRGNVNHLCSQLHFRDADIHVEFMLPEKGKGNSGIYIHGNYELQILKSHDVEKVTQQHMGSLYGFAKPLVNAALPPGKWQVYDIRYRAPRRNENGKIVEKGSVTAWLNGKKVQSNTRFGEPKSVYHPFRHGNTKYLDKICQQQKKTSTGPVFLQDHNSPVRFRNVWIKPLDDKAMMYDSESAKELQKK